MSGATAARLSAAFADRTGEAPAGLIRAPGRVNLIGEHIDYNGFGVLPMAIDRELLAAWRPRADGRVLLASLDGYPDRDFMLEPRIPLYGPGDWGNYAKAAAQGLLDARLALRGTEILVSSTLPAAAGLSSSSALVVLCALALLQAAGLSMPRTALASLLAEAEKYVGTQGGGMDQAASLLGRAGCALRIDFRPLRVTPLPFFAGHVIVVANSLVRAPKAEAAGYNNRAVECRLATEILCRRTGSAGPLLADVAAAAPAATLLSLLPQPLARRARHVLTEAARVEAACAAAAAGDAQAMGALMNESHASCRDDFEISCPALERLVELARANGALGARLTGAGFGGCTVSLVERERAPTLVAAMADRYYGGSPEDALFAVEPADGAGPVARRPPTP